jgi:hypothetical protein
LALVVEWKLMLLLLVLKKKLKKLMMQSMMMTMMMMMLIRKCRDDDSERKWWRSGDDAEMLTIHVEIAPSPLQETIHSPCHAAVLLSNQKYHVWFVTIVELVKSSTGTCFEIYWKISPRMALLLFCSVSVDSSF